MAYPAHVLAEVARIKIVASPLKLFLAIGSVNYNVKTINAIKVQSDIITLYFNNHSFDHKSRYPEEVAAYIIDRMEEA